MNIKPNDLGSASGKSSLFSWSYATKCQRSTPFGMSSKVEENADTLVLL